VARFDGDALTAHVSTQQVAELKTRIAKKFKLDPAKVRVIAEHIGGGFGSKATLADETISAIKLAQAAKAPVRVAFDRHEELSVAGYRPATEVKIALLPGRDGALKALSVVAYSDAGVAVNSTVAGLARLIYPAEAKELVDNDVVSDLPPGCAFRGPGGPPMAFALEQAIDETALRLKLDAIQLRKRWDPNPNRQRLYDWASALETWRRRPGPGVQTGRYRRGVGVAAGYWLYLWQLGTKVALAIQDGRLTASVATQDIGTGTRSVIADTVAREFGLEPHEIEVHIGDSILPNGPGSGGSRVTASIVPPLLVAAEKLKAGVAEKTGRRPAPGSNAPWRELIAASPDFNVEAGRAEDNPRTIYGNNSLLKDAGMIGWIFGFMMRRSSHVAIGAGAPSSVQVVEVEVDMALGHVRVLRAHSGVAVGKLAAPALARNQAAGAIVQGLGYALYEGREVDCVTGDVLTTSLDDYRMPGVADIPPIDLYFDEGGFDHVHGGSVGIGEVATVPTSAAIANAIHNAIGLRPYEIPLRPDRLIALLDHRSAA
jgi:xanthine dehydrogenase YagR molybdenum-binding subunit